jgi:hypothetical protein
MVSKYKGVQLLLILTYKSNNMEYKHYNNEQGSLYKFAEHHELNAWEFDCIKRLVRCRKKGQWLSDIDKTIKVLELYKEEMKHLNNDDEIINLK